MDDPSWALWPPERFHEAVFEALLRAEFPLTGGRIPPLANNESHVRWLRHGARPVGCEGFVQDASLGNGLRYLAKPGPYFVMLHARGDFATAGVALIVKTRGHCTVVLPDGSEETMRTAAFLRRLQRGRALAQPLATVFATLDHGVSTLHSLTRDDALESNVCSIAQYELDATHPITLQLAASRPGRPESPSGSSASGGSTSPCSG